MAYAKGIQIESKCKNKDYQYKQVSGKTVEGKKDFDSHSPQVDLDKTKE